MYTGMSSFVRYKVVHNAIFCKFLVPMAKKYMRLCLQLTFYKKPSFTETSVAMFTIDISRKPYIVDVYKKNQFLLLLNKDNGCVFFL
jgi:hypothetical protein